MGNHPVIVVSSSSSNSSSNSSSSSSSNSAGPDVVVVNASPNSKSRTSTESQIAVTAAGNNKSINNPINTSGIGSSTSNNNNNNNSNNYYMRMSDELGLDELSLTYYEVEYLPFKTLLHDIGAVDGQIFYDLGCGVGKALVAASLSGIRFMKCIGVEILPTLSSTAQTIVNTLSSIQHLKSIAYSHHSHSYRGSGVSKVGSISNRDQR